MSARPLFIACALAAPSLALLSGCPGDDRYDDTHETCEGLDPDSFASCGGNCVSIAIDPEHCGGCGIACGDGQECHGGECCDPDAEPPPRELDLLLLIDNSNSMTEEQASLAVELPRLVSILATGDTDQDGVRDVDPVDSLHLGIITADMGTGGHLVPTCRDSNFGDDGLLRTAGNTAITGCADTYPKFVDFEPGLGSDPAAMAQDVTCVARMGTGGCGFEQQLEAVLKAITPATSPTRFVHGTTGHGDGANAGFVREDSALAIIILSDEGDCSVADTDLFDPDSATYPGNLNLRCLDYPDALRPVQRYVDGLLALRPDGERLSYTLIGGVPTDLSGADPDTILADDRMVLRVDPEDPNRLAPSCNEPGRGLAFPPRRMVQVAGDLADAGAQTEVRSICDADFFPALTAALDRIWVTLDQGGDRCLATGD